MTPRQRVELCMAVDAFTENYAKFLSLKLKVENGVVLGDEDLKNLSTLMDTISSDITHIRECEEKFGYESVGIPINGNNMNFQGFSIQDGELIGDLSYAYRIAFPWYCSFYKGEKTETADFFKFFMASFISHLKDMYMPEELPVAGEEQKESDYVEVQKKVKRKRFGFLSSFFKKGA